jgi:hypothetical protein
MSVFLSVWGVVDVINNSPQLKIKVPDKEQRLNIVKGFKSMSGEGFDKVVGAIDGILIWIVKPDKRECKDVNCGDKSFFVPGKANLVLKCRQSATIN